MTQLIFEGVDGNIIPQTEEDLPYDLKADHIFIDDVDFGTWYVDAYEHRSVTSTRRSPSLHSFSRPKGMPANMLIPGRQIMTCCADDIRFYGYPCNLGRADADHTEKLEKSNRQVRVRSVPSDGSKAAGSLYAGDGIRRKTGRRGSISWINFKY